jgi:hypothetical protein
VGAIDRSVHVEGLQVGASGGIVHAYGLDGSSVLAGASGSSFLAGGSSSSLLAGASGLLGKELLASGVLLVGAINCVVHAEGLQAGASGGN